MRAASGGAAASTAEPDHNQQREGGRRLRQLIHGEQSSSSFNSICAKHAKSTTTSTYKSAEELFIQFGQICGLDLQKGSQVRCRLCKGMAALVKDLSFGQFFLRSAVLCNSVCIGRFRSDCPFTIEGSFVFSQVDMELLLAEQVICQQQRFFYVSFRDNATCPWIQRCSGSLASQNDEQTVCRVSAFFFQKVPSDSSS